MPHPSRLGFCSSENKEEKKGGQETYIEQKHVLLPVVILLTNHLTRSDLEGKWPTPVSTRIKLANGIKAIQPTRVMLET